MDGLSAAGAAARIEAIEASSVALIHEQSLTAVTSTLDPMTTGL